MSEEQEGELSLNLLLSLLSTPNDRNDKLPFIRHWRGGGAYIDRTVDKVSFVIFVVEVG